MLCSADQGVGELVSIGCKESGAKGTTSLFLIKSGAGTEEVCDFPGETISIPGAISSGTTRNHSQHPHQRLPGPYVNVLGELSARKGMYPAA